MLAWTETKRYKSGFLLPSRNSAEEGIPTNALMKTGPSIFDEPVLELDYPDLPCGR
jgi:hypothetical protein